MFTDAHGFVQPHVVWGPNGVPSCVDDGVLRVVIGDCRDGHPTGGNPYARVEWSNSFVSTQAQGALTAADVVTADGQCVLPGCPIRTLDTKRSGFDGGPLGASGGDNDDFLVCHAS